MIAVVTRGNCFSWLCLRQTFEFEISGAGKKMADAGGRHFFLGRKKIFHLNIFRFAQKFRRVSEYLMGDLDSNISLASSVSSKTKVTMVIQL